MKKIVLNFLILILIILGFSNLYGQDALNKGVYSIAGSAQYSTSSESSDNNTITLNQGNISPQFTYFVCNHISLGVSMDYNYYFNEGSSYSNSGEHNIKLTYITLGPAFRYYSYTKKIIPFLEASFLYGIENMGDENVGNQYEYTYQLKAGLELFLSNNVALEPSIGYTYYHYTMSSFNLSGDVNNFSIGVGVSYFIF